MTAVFNIVVPILAGIGFLAALYFAWQAIVARSRSSLQPYDVGRQEVRQQMQVNFLRSGIALILGLILLGVMGLRPLAFEREPVATPLPPSTDVPTAVLSATATPTLSIPTVAATPTSPLPTPTATLQPTPTFTPAPQTATVNSEVGVWLRAAPSVESEQLEWLLNGTEVIVLPGRETADDLEWQQVQLTNGTQGWVAAEFLQINDP